MLDHPGLSRSSSGAIYGFSRWRPVLAGSAPVVVNVFNNTNVKAPRLPSVCHGSATVLSQFVPVYHCLSNRGGGGGGGGAKPGK